MSGFNLPPGCSVSDLPGNGPDQPCEVCGGWPEGGEPACICPECPYCGDYGNPACYEPRETETERQRHGLCHGLRRNATQEAQLAEQEKRWALANEAEGVAEAYMDGSFDEDIAKRDDYTPAKIKSAITECERCLHVLSRAFDAGIQPRYAADRLLTLAQEIAQITHQWLPPNQPAS